MFVANFFEQNGDDVQLLFQMQGNYVPRIGECIRENKVNYKVINVVYHIPDKRRCNVKMEVSIVLRKL